MFLVQRIQTFNEVWQSSSISGKSSYWLLKKVEAEGFEPITSQTVDKRKESGRIEDFGKPLHFFSY